jgi:hypothetical protein
MAGEPLLALRERVRPVTLTGEQRLPAAPALADVLPGGGVRRGSVVAVEGPGSTSLLWSLLAPPTEAGSWAVVVGLPSAGLEAAAGAGVALERLAVVAPPGRSWATVLGALLDGFDLVVAAPARIGASDARRLAARARERGTVMVLAGSGAAAWPEGADLRLALTAPGWEGLGRGHGHLQRRRVHLEVSGRREAARPRSTDLWLPARVDAVAPAEPTAAPALQPVGPSVGELVRAAS